MSDTRPDLVLIAALARGRAIGRANQLPWHLPEDLAHFRRSTQGAPVLMGRRTWESLPERFRPLPGRRNLVLSRQAGLACPGAEVVGSVPEALARCAGVPRVFVIGGAELYVQALPLADELLLTELALDVPDADAFFPDWPAAEFAEVARQTIRPAPPNEFDVAFVTYRRRPR
ncbi:dihydrofolate reductase [Ideonella sp. 4Y11]|uniref:Dihydrofolate reductase n=1 Tax=Ideonella aquatica TaxID=2824119 RepID=A0A941BMU0_9BURK|nr:dihydrofolate reductase [Ideonella aquatica]MBQ0961214.1 dihydrofolate reductase [Ideonella aquatica]